MSELRTRDLVGSWLLVEWRIDYPNARPSAWPFGVDAVGLIVYGDDGWMTATMSHRSRTALSAASALKADQASKARAFQEYLTYAGRWSVANGRIAHDVEMSLNPALIGTRQWREAALEGARLVLGATEPLGAGQLRRHRIVWRRP
jgi:hypothetical protein